jgi:hypothetical protein
VAATDSCKADKRRVDRRDPPGALPARKLLVVLVEFALGSLRESLRARARARRAAATPPAGSSSPALRALTLAAMALPGMACAAELEDAHIQYSGYKEGGRNLWRGPNGTVKAPPALEVQSLELGLGLRLGDRTRLVFDYAQDTWSGATPILSAPEGFLTVTGASAYPATNGLVNRQLVPYGIGPGGIGPGGTRVPQPTVWNVMTGASAETRRQFDLTLSQEWDEAALAFGGGISQEPDFSSYFAHLNGQWDLNRKLTTLNAGLSYTTSDIDANLGPPETWIDYGQYRNAASGPSIITVARNGQLVQKFVGDREDWSANLGLTQVLSRNSTLSLGLTYTHSSGFLENPYKLVMLAFANPATPPPLFGGLWATRLFNVAESRPDTRSQWAVNAGLSHYVAAARAGLHFNLGYAQDDWGIRSQTAELDWNQGLGRGWLVTPRVRYYSQSAADFYQPYFIWGQRVPLNAAGTLNFGAVPVQYYSSDYRLSAFGAVSAGLSLSKRFENGLTVQAGAEYYVHAGGLKLGGGGTASFADFDYWMLSLGLGVDLTARPSAPDGAHAEHVAGPAAPSSSNSAKRHASHAGLLAPAGLQYAHMLDRSEPFMVGYRAMLGLQSGDVLRGSTPATDAQIAANACGAVECSMAPSKINMTMHMLDLMYAASDRVSLMAMFQFVDMDMDMRMLDGAVVDSGGHGHGASMSQSTGGLGDAGLGALLGLVRTADQALHLGLALSVPIGSVNETTSSDVFTDYGMQLGSGTWDLVPSLTYSGLRGRWFWGAQLNGVWRTSDANDSGYALGDMFQTTAWGGMRLTSWMSASLRGVYTVQNSIQGEYNGTHTTSSPTDFPQNYGGRYWDLGLGLSFALPGSAPRGDRISFEWLQPLSQDVNGYQLERTGSAWLNLSLAF